MRWFIIFYTSDEILFLNQSSDGNGLFEDVSSPVSGSRGSTQVQRDFGRQNCLIDPGGGLGGISDLLAWLACGFVGRCDGLIYLKMWNEIM